MNISVFGLGYVGCVSAASFASDGHRVIGVDVNPQKVATVQAGHTPIVEPGLDELILRAVEQGRLTATTSTAEAVNESEVSLVCVGTPSRRNGSLDLTYLVRVAEQIGHALCTKQTYHVVVVRSTVLPGTTHEQVIPALEAASGKKYGEGFGVSVNPEFLREGTALNDFRNPPLTLVGHNHAADASGTIGLYANVQAPVVNTSIRVAEMIKYTSNTWHALKITFANEIGNVCRRLGVDSHEVMDIFSQDRKLNISPSYLKPGFAFGGSCLPKDVRALQYRAKELDLDLPVINSILDSNRLQIQHAIDEVLEIGRKRVGLLGFSFKAGTDDLRESPIVILAEALLGKGLQVRIYDRNVSLARQIPHLSSLLRTSVQEVIDESDVIVVGNASAEFREALIACRSDQVIIDLVRIPVDRAQVAAEYRGICW
jgi:GDP-mannose 6-dehydrogenase